MHFCRFLAHSNSFTQFVIISESFCFSLYQAELLTFCTDIFFNSVQYALILPKISSVIRSSDGFFTTKNVHVITALSPG